MNEDFELETRRIRVREIAIARLERLARRPGSTASQSFLFQNDQFAGVRFRSGPFHADWFYDSATIQFFHGNEQIDQLLISEGADRQAA